MLNIGGELSFILQDIDYTSKKDLLDKLRTMRDDLQNYPKEERLKIKPILAISIQQAFYASEWELMRYRKFCDYRSENGKKDDKSSGEGAK